MSSNSLRAFELLRRVRDFMGGIFSRGFSHDQSLRYELSSAEHFIEMNFESLFAEIETAKNKGERWPGRDELEVDGFYGGSHQAWMELAKHVEEKTCLEIGPGPCGALVCWWWVKDRIFIDPLIDEYKRLSLGRFKKTWYTDDLNLLAQAAEDLIPDLVGAVDGAIICRNALDHCADPMSVLKNISAYAKPGCYLLLWTDLWHLTGHDAGHRDITKDREGFQESIKHLGFDILYSFDSVRQDGSTIEYGCRARKINFGRSANIE